MAERGDWETVPREKEHRAPKLQLLRFGKDEPENKRNEREVS